MHIFLYGWNHERWVYIHVCVFVCMCVCKDNFVYRFLGATHLKNHTIKQIKKITKLPYWPGTYQ